MVECHAVGLDNECAGAWTTSKDHVDFDQFLFTPRHARRRRHEYKYNNCFLFFVLQSFSLSHRSTLFPVLGYDRSASARGLAVAARTPGRPPATMASSLQQAKRVLRRQVKKRLKKISPDTMEKYSRAIARQVVGLEAVQKSKRVSVYLSLPQGEIMTLPLVEELYRQRKQVYIPKVDGPQPPQMRMLQATSMEELASFPLSRWKIPEPLEEEARGMPDALDPEHGAGKFVCFAVAL